MLDYEVKTWAENRSCLTSQRGKKGAGLGGVDGGAFGVVLLIVNKQAARPLGGDHALEGQGEAGSLGLPASAEGRDYLMSQYLMSY